MPAVAITVPGVGESISEGILARWLKSDGAAVKAGEPLFELETDKASNVVPATASGLRKINVPEGTTVPIGATVGTIDPDGQARAQAQETATATPTPTASEKPSPAPRAAASNGGAAAGALSPAARRVVIEEKLDPAAITG